MCNAASEGDRYSGRTEPAEVMVPGRRRHFCVASYEMWPQNKTLVPPTITNFDLAQDFGHNYAINGPIYTIWWYEWIAKK